MLTAIFNTPKELADFVNTTAEEYDFTSSTIVCNSDGKYVLFYTIQQKGS